MNLTKPILVSVVAAALVLGCNSQDPSGSTSARRNNPETVATMSGGENATITSETVNLAVSGMV